MTCDRIRIRHRAGIPAVARVALALLLALGVAPAAELRVMTWNVWFDATRAAERLPALLDAIHAAAPDVLAVQEAEPWFLDGFAADPRFAGWKAAALPDGARAAGGCQLLSRHPIARERELFLPSRYGRRALIAEVLVAGTAWTVAIVHLDSLMEDGPRRERQMALVQEAMRGINHALWLGDFNFGDADVEQARIEPGWVDAWSTARPGEPGATWDPIRSALARANSFPDEPARRLDRILVRSSTHRPTAATLHGNAPLRPADPLLFPSDHFGVSAVLTQP